MKIKVLQQKLAEILTPHKVAVETRQEDYSDKYRLISIELADDCRMVGFVPCDFEVNFETIANQVKAAESKGEKKAVYILEGSTRIPNKAFLGCTSLLSLTIPEGVNEIGKWAFKGCDSLQNVTIPQSVSKIRESAFERCTSLQNVTIPDSVTLIGKEAFFKCTSLQNLTIPYGDIGQYAFAFCDNLTCLTIVNNDKGARNLASSAFEGCTALTTVNLPKDLTWGKIKSKFKDSPYSKENPAYAEANAKKAMLKKMAETSIEALARAAVDDMDAKVQIKETEVIIDAHLENGAVLYAVVYKEKDTQPDKIKFDKVASAVKNAVPGALNIVGVAILTEGMFEGRSDFSSIVFPPNLKEIQRGTFANCASLRKLVIPEGLATVSGFNGCAALEEITFPNTLEEIGRSAFDACTSLETVCLPPSVKIIGDFAFADCTGLKNINIPTKVEKIGYKAFQGCTSLKKLIVPANVKEFGYNEIGANGRNMTITWD